MRLPATVRRAVVAHALREQPIECCGLLLSMGRAVAFAVPMRNVDASPSRYRMDDRAHIDLRRVLRDVVPPLTICGVYHSHPTGDPFPSEIDVAQALYPEWVHVIVGLRSARPVIRAFRIRGGQAHPVALR